MREPIVVAHRGLAGHAPENTLASYSAALDLGLGLEIDLALTRDGEIVNIHDGRLDRTTSGSGPVGETPLAAIRPLDAGSWFHPSFADQRVPTLRETLGLVQLRRRAETLIALDFKETPTAIEAHVCRLLAQFGLVDQSLAIGAPIRDQAMRERIREADPHMPTARLVDEADWANALEDPTADWLYIRFLPRPEQTAMAHARGRRIFVAGALVAGLEPANWRLMHDAGVDAILTDYPLDCRRALREDTA